MRLYTYEKVDFGDLPHGSGPNWFRNTDTIELAGSERYLNALAQSEFYRNIEVGEPFNDNGREFVSVSYDVYTEFEYVDVKTLGEAQELLKRNPHLAICWDGETLTLDESPITINA